MKTPIQCPDCETDLQKVNYTSYGEKIFNSDTGKYSENENWGAGDLEFTCPYCFVTLDLTEEEFTQLL